MITVPDAAEIKRIFEEEQQRGLRKVYDLDQVPTSYDALTIEWLTKVMCPGSPNAEVTAFSLDARDDGFANRRRIFLEYNEAGRAAGLPGSVFCKANESLLSRVVLGVHMTAQGEANFYRHVRDRLPIEAPVAHYAGFDPHNCAYLVVLRDIASEVTFCGEETVIDESAVRQQLDLLATLHGAFYQSPELGTESVPYVTWPQWWDNMVKRVPDYQEALQEGLLKAESVLPARLFGQRDRVWNAIEKSVLRHDALPLTLSHNDPHLRNWYITADGRMGLGDWQIMTVGHWSRDVGYCLATSLSTAERRKWETSLVASYLDMLVEMGGERVSVDEALSEVGLQLMTALAFWVTTLKPPADRPDAQPPAAILSFIERMSYAIDDLGVLDSV